MRSIGCQQYLSWNCGDLTWISRTLPYDKVVGAVIKAVCAPIKVRCVAINWQRCRVLRVATNARGSIIART
jgi:hypothetical protein